MSRKENLSGIERRYVPLNNSKLSRDPSPGTCPVSVESPVFKIYSLELELDPVFNRKCH